MAKILITYQIPREGLRGLADRHELIWPADLRMTKEELNAHLPDTVGLLAASLKVDRALLAQAPQLRIIANYGTGYDHIDVAAAAERGVAVTNTPTAVTEATAELAFGLLLALCRRIPEQDRQLRTEPDFRWGMMLRTGISLRGKVLGIIGFGQIGQRLAQMAAGFGLRVVYHNRRPLTATQESTLGAQYLPFEDLLRQADFVSLHVPLTPETRHLINAERLALLKPTAVLVNTARGAVIDELALLNALENRRLAGTALDVFEWEPKITEGLKKLDNVVMTPHIGTDTWEARLAMAEEAALNLQRFFEGEIPPNLVG